RGPWSAERVHLLWLSPDDDHDDGADHHLHDDHHDRRHHHDGRFDHHDHHAGGDHHDHGLDDHDHATDHHHHHDVDDHDHHDHGFDDNDDHVATVRACADVDQLELQRHADPGEQLHLVQQRPEGSGTGVEPGDRALRCTDDPVQRCRKPVRSERAKRLDHLLADGDARDDDLQHGGQRVGNRGSVVGALGQ